MRHWIITLDETFTQNEELAIGQQFLFRCSRYGEHVGPDNLVILWQDGTTRGIIGAGKVVSDPELDPKDNNGAAELQVLVSHLVPLLPSLKARNIAELKNCAIFHRSQPATIFRMNDKEWQIFIDLIEGRRKLP